MVTFKKVETEDELNEVYKLRFKVYCQERGFEPETAYPEQCEIDEYDAYSIHFIAKIGLETVGTLRLILDNPNGFPMERCCKLNVYDKHLKKNKTAEFSRFAISKEIVKSTGSDRREIVLGLFKQAYQESKNLRINYFYAVMGRGLQKLLTKCGIIFIQVGPLIDYHGLRAPYISEIKAIEESMFMKNIDLFRFITAPPLYQYA